MATVLAIALIVLNIVGIVLLGMKIGHVFFSILGYIILLVVLANISENALVLTLVAGAVITLIALIGTLVGWIRDERGWKKSENEQTRRNSDLLDAVNKGDRQAAQKLIEEGASVNHTLGDKPALQIAVEKGDKDMVSLLLDKGADINRPGGSGDKPALLIAVEKGDKDMASLLLDKGADVNLVHNGRHLLDYTKDDEMIALLKSRGAVTRSEAFEMGWRFYTGEGAAQDYEKAVEWLEKAAELGHASAQYHLGLCYAEGKGVAQSKYEAVKWYEKAAEQGYASAQNNLGVCYDNGEGVTQDSYKAFKLYEKSAEQGDIVAQSNLGFCYLNGTGVYRDNKKAAELFKKAAEQGKVDAMYGLGCAYLGLDRRGEAKEWFEKAAVQGHQRALEELRNLQ